jgi:hypothetical protein
MLLIACVTSLLEFNLFLNSISIEQTILLQLTSFQMYINNSRNKSLSQPSSPQIPNSHVYSPMPFRTPVFSSSNRLVTAFPLNELDKNLEQPQKKVSKPNKLLLHRLHDLMLDENEPVMYFDLLIQIN